MARYTVWLTLAVVLAWVACRAPELTMVMLILLFVGRNDSFATPTNPELLALGLAAAFVLMDIDGALIGAVGVWAATYYCRSYTWSRLPLTSPEPWLAGRTPDLILTGSGLGVALTMAAPWAPLALGVTIAAVCVVGDRLTSTPAARW